MYIIEIIEYNPFCYNIYFIIYLVFMNFIVNLQYSIHLYMACFAKCVIQKCRK